MKRSYSSGTATMAIEIYADKINCEGCAAAIKRGLAQDTRLGEVSVEVATGRVSVDAPEAMRERVAERLRELGFPPRD
jgi:copper chaperone CopZ